MIIWANIFIVPVLHPKASGDRSELFEPKSLVKVSRVDIAFHNGIKLQYSESKFFTCGNAMPSSTTSFQIRIISSKSFALYALIIIFFSPNRRCKPLFGDSLPYS